MAARTAGTRALPTTRPSSARSPSSSQRIDGRFSALGLEPLSFEPVEDGGTVPGDARGRARVGRRNAVRDGHGRVRRRRIRRRARAPGRGARRPRRPRRRPRLRLPRARLRARVPGPLRRVRDRRAGHGLDRCGARASRPAAGRQLVRVVSRVAGERADLQPGERADEGRLCAALRRAHPRRPREVAPVGARHLAPGGASGHDDRAARKLGGGASAPALGGRGGRRRRRDPARHRAVAAADRASRRRRARTRRGCSATAATRCSSRTGRCMLHEALTASELLAERGIGLAVANMPWLNRFDAEWLEALAVHEELFVLEDHSPVGGLGDALRRELRSRAHGVRRRGLARVWDAPGGPTRARARRRLARAAHLVVARQAGVDGEARLARPPRPVPDARLRRLRDRLGARATRSTAPWRSCSRSRRTRPETGRRSWERFRGFSARISFPAPSERSSASSDGSTSLSIGASATTHSRFGTVFAAASTASACGRDTRTSSWTRRSPDDCRSPSASTRSSGDGCSRDAGTSREPSSRGCVTPAPGSWSRTCRACRRCRSSNAARRLGLPTVGYVASWDHTVGKGIVSPHVDRYVVQNDVMRGDLTRLHSIPYERIVVTGWPQTDVFRVQRSRESFDAIVGSLRARSRHEPWCSSRGTRRPTHRTRGRSSSGS